MINWSAAVNGVTVMSGWAVIICVGWDDSEGGRCDDKRVRESKRKRVRESKRESEREGERVREKVREKVRGTNIWREKVREKGRGTNIWREKVIERQIGRKRGWVPQFEDKINRHKMNYRNQIVIT